MKTKTKGKNSRKKTLIFFLQGSKRYFVLGILFSLLVAFLDLILPKIVQYSVDHVLDDKEITSPVVAYLINMFGGAAHLRSHLYLIATCVAVIAVMGGVFRYLYRLFNAMGAEKLVKRMRDELYLKLQKLPVTWHEKNHTGDIIQRCTSDVETVKAFLSEQIMNLFRVGIMIVLGMTFMIGINFKFALISSVYIPVVILYSVFFHNKIASAFLHADEEEGKLSAIAQENLTGVRVVRAFGREEYERGRFSKQNQDYTRMWIRLMAWLSAFWCSNDFIAGFQIMMVIVIGSVFCVRGYLSIGGYIAFVSYNGMLSWPVRELGRVISDMSKAGISTDRIGYIMDSEIESQTEDVSGPLPDEPLDIVFDHVTFAYDDGTEVIKDVSFTIKAGSTFGILGATGSGKSTLMCLLNRLFELPPDKGTITIGGRDIRTIDRHELRRYVGFIMQEAFLFSGTIAWNIALTGDDDFDMETVKGSAQVAELDETIRGFKDGYETYVGERGVTLSGGQKQRVAIARMVMSDPPVKVFDDSLSAVDTKTDMQIRKNLAECTQSSSVVLISHRITTLMHSDNIIVLDHGRVAESGTHDELLEAGGIYRKIFDIQTAGAAT